MKSKKMLVLVLAIVFFAGSIGLGVHTLHKKAYANNYVSCYVNDGEDGVYVEHMLHIHFYLDDQLVVADEMDLGGTCYFYDEAPDQTEYDRWDIEIIPNFGWAPDAPLMSPHDMQPSQTFLEWVVTPE